MKMNSERKNYNYSCNKVLKYIFLTVLNRFNPRDYHAILNSHEKDGVAGGTF